MKQRSILLIDDDIIFLKSIKILLETAGFTVLTARNGNEGVQLAKDYLPDLIVCDVTMPEMNGHQVLSELSEDLSTNTIPFVYVTANSTREDFRKGMDLGADDYIFKPFTHNELLSVIELRLKKHYGGN